MGIMLAAASIDAAIEHSEDHRKDRELVVERESHAHGAKETS